MQICRSRSGIELGASVMTMSPWAKSSDRSAPTFELEKLDMFPCSTKQPLSHRSAVRGLAGASPPDSPLVICGKRAGPLLGGGRDGTVLDTVA